MALGQISTGSEQKFNYGIRNLSTQTVATPVNVVTQGADGTYGKATYSTLPLTTTQTNALNLKADKTDGATQITDPNAHLNLSTSANATQSVINSAIDTYAGSITNKFETRIAVNDADYTITGSNNQLIAYTNLTTTRTVNLPAATTANQRIWITDESGLASSARAISVVPNGSDTVSGASATVVNFPNGSGYFESNGAGKWNIISTTAVQFSAGVNTLPTITDLGTGSVTLGSGVYSLFANATGVGRPKGFAIAGSTFALTDQMTTYITAQYNTTTGAVSLVATTVESTINYTTVVPIFKIFRDGLVLHIADYDSLGVALSNKLQRSWEKTQAYRFEPGSVLLGESATRVITVTSGTIWRGAVEIPLTAVASNVQTCYQFVNTSGTWSKSVITQYNNTQWNDTGGLVTLSGGRYAVSFVYRSIGTDTDIAVVLGTGDYNLGQAQTSSPPTNLPAFITSHMVLVGRIIVLKSATTSTQIDSANTTGVIFTSAGVTDHNALNNLQTAQTGVTYGHITDAAQIIAGDKNFTGTTTIQPVSSSQSGMVNNTSLQELGGVDKTINGVRIGKGLGNIASNTVVGAASFLSNSTGSQNTAIGDSVLQSAVSAVGNTVVGRFGLVNVNTGGFNTSLGTSSGAKLNDKSTNLTSVSNSVFLGYNTSALAQGDDNEIVIGFNSNGLGSNKTVLGNSSTTQTYLAGRTTVNTTTDNGTDQLQVNGSVLVSSGSIKSDNAINLLTSTSTAQKLNTAGLLVSNTYSDAPLVPTNGIYSKGNILSAGSITGTSFVKTSGTSSQFLKADGSVDSSTYAPLASPALTGTPTAPTPTAGDSSTQIATTAFVTSSLPSSGTYTPTLTNTANITSSTFINSTYTKIGNVVTVTVGFDVTPSAANVNSQLNISLPFNKSGSSLVYLGSGTLKDISTGLPLSISAASTSTTTIFITAGYPTTNKFVGSVTFQYTL